ncbi:unnamed protein product [Spirodela intermedia]|uniref:Uncharacterized protein n=1 Tax=Spirodela intermedia TaxID=51605 RepID=A0A7I8L856_SPIIN|nr:unnamed protein product [Spirodela intermedia]
MASGLRAPAFILLLIFLGVFAATEATSVPASADVLLSGISGGRCNGSIAECLGGGEFEMGSEVSRRILQSNNYISNRAVTRNNRPASSSASSGRRYTPGCSTYNRCKR